MRTRTMIGLLSVGVAAFGVATQDFAVVVISAAWGALAYHLHAIEVKLNKLLDFHRIQVLDSEIAKD